MESRLKKRYMKNLKGKPGAFHKIYMLTLAKQAAKSPVQLYKVPFYIVPILSSSMHATVM